MKANCVLQVLHRLEIRPRQLHVAEHLLDNLSAQHGNDTAPGAVTQLNMGEGKTRVILPLLVLALAGSGDVVRMNFLGELLADAAGDFERTLTGAPLRLAWLWQHLELPPLVACIRLRDAQAAAAEVCRMHSCTQALLARAHRFALCRQPAEGADLSASVLARHPD